MRFSERPLHSTAWLQFLLSGPALIKSSWNPLSTNRLFPSNQNCSLTNQDSAFGPIKLPGFGALIYMTAQSATRARNSCLYKPVPLWLWEHFFFLWRLCLFWWLETVKMSPHRKQKIQHPAYNGGAELFLCPPPPHSFHSSAVALIPQLSYLHNVSFSTPEGGDSCSYSMTISLENPNHFRLDWPQSNLNSFWNACIHNSYCYFSIVTI